MDIYDRMRNGEVIYPADPDYDLVLADYERAYVLTSKLNQNIYDPESRRLLLEELTCSEIDETVRVIPPFHTDFGKNIRFGKNIFVNSECQFLDQGGITIEDDVMFGPRVCLVTSNHPKNVENRRGTVSTPIRICRGAWVGANSTILPGITVGENSIVAAGAVVTKDVPPNVVVGGNPAKIIKSIFD